MTYNLQKGIKITIVKYFKMYVPGRKNKKKRKLKMQ